MPSRTRRPCSRWWTRTSSTSGSRWQNETNVHSTGARVLTLLRLAARNLTRNRRRTAISLAALIVCMAAMITLRGFVDGMQRMILENFIEGQTGAIQIHKKGYLANVQGSPLDLNMEDTAALREKIARVPG